MKAWKARYFTIWSGQSLSLVGSVAAQFALVWWVTKTTGSATVLATATLVATTPFIFLRPFIGVLVDRLSRRKVVLISDSFIALISLWLAFLFWTGTMEIWHVYVVMFARAIGGAFHQTAMNASITLLVPKKHYARLEGINQVMDGSLSVLGPLLGAMLVALLPLHGIMALDFATAAFAVVPLLFLSIPQPEVPPGEKDAKPRFWDDFRAGLRYVLNWRGLIALTGLLVVMNLALAPSSSLVPLLVVRAFGGEALFLGTVNAAMGLGTVLGGLLLSAWGGFRKKIVTTLIAVSAVGCAYGVIAFAPATMRILAIGGFFVGGMCIAIANGCLRATFRGTVQPSMQGRVGSLMGSMATAMNPIGLAIAGPVADMMGIRSWFVITAIMLLAGGLGGLLLPALRNIESEAEGRWAAVQPEPECSAAD